MAEIIEQIVRIAMVVLLLFWIDPGSYETATIFIVLGIVAGELSSLLYLHTNYYNKTKSFSNEPVSASISSRVANIASIAVPVTFTRLALTTLNSVNSILIPRD